jgi:PAS domain S-box-containing protein
VRSTDRDGAEEGRRRKRKTDTRLRHLLQKAEDAVFTDKTHDGSVLERKLKAFMEKQGAPEDIELSDQKEFEERLKESEQRLADIIDFLPDATLVISRDGKVIAWNKAIEEMTGVKAEDILGKNNYEYALPFYGERRPILIDLVFLPHDEIKKKYITLEWKGATLVGIAHIRALSGRTDVVLHGTASILKNSKGEVIGAIESIRDITERVRAEEALNESRRQLEEIIQFLPDATLVIDREGRIIAWNRAIEEMTGFKAEEMLNKGDYEYAIPFYGERRPILIDLVTMPREIVQQKYLTIHREKDTLMGDADCPMVRRERRFLSGWASPIYNIKGEIIGTIESIRDITDRVRAEQALNESRRQLEEIIDFLPDATLVLDESGKIIAWNRAIEEMTGFKAEEMLGKVNFEHSIPFYGERRPILVDLVTLPSEVIEEKYYFLRREKGILMGDADCPMVRRERRFLSGWATPIYNLKGDIIGAIESIRDVTEKKLAEEEREKLIGELREAFMKIKMLKGLIPICSSCKKIRDDKGYWNQIEVYIREHSDAEFSHSICPECTKKLYPNFNDK